MLERFKNFVARHPILVPNLVVVGAALVALLLTSCSLPQNNPFEAVPAQTKWAREACTLFKVDNQRWNRAILFEPDTRTRIGSVPGKTRGEIATCGLRGQSGFVVVHEMAGPTYRVDLSGEGTWPNVGTIVKVELPVNIRGRYMRITHEVREE